MYYWESESNFWRQYRNFTQEKLAEKVELTPGFISLMETGKKRASLETLIRVCKELEITFNDLVVGNKITEPGDYSIEFAELIGQSVLCDTYLLFLVEFIGDNNEKKNPHPTDFTCRRKHRSANEDSICKLGYRGAICYLEPLLILRVLPNCREVRLLNMLKQFPPQPTSETPNECDSTIVLYDTKPKLSSIVFHKAV